jgi:hypothetical protein
MDQERTDFRQFDKRVDVRTVPETQHEHRINTFPHGCVIGARCPRSSTTIFWVFHVNPQ